MIPALLASQATALPDPNGYVAVGWVLAVLVVLGGAVVLFRKVFGHNPPLHKEYASKTDVEKLETELKRHAARRVEIYNEQKAQGEKLARLETATTAQSKDISDLKDAMTDVNKRIDAIPERTVGLLIDAQRLTRQ